MPELPVRSASQPDLLEAGSYCADHGRFLSYGEAVVKRCSWCVQGVPGNAAREALRQAQLVTLKCVRCKAAPLGEGRAYYCGEACNNADIAEAAAYKEGRAVYA
jgi:hypothetical protein